MNEQLSIVVVGASGDLARKKVFPALFALYCQGLLPAGFNVFGFARTKLTDTGFRTLIEEHLTCRYTPDKACGVRMKEFLTRCRYVAGRYSASESFLDLFEAMREHERNSATNRVFYLAIPPSVFVDVARAIGGAGFVSCDPGQPWSRAVVEKPFGRDRQSSDALTMELANVFTEEQTYRIDHYLGKEVIQNLLVLRFANIVFEPIWNNRHIESVEIAWKEAIGIEGRGAYFDEFGIVRDVMQNHLLQILALIAMEPPAKLEAASIVASKISLLKLVAPVRAADMVLGQYAAGMVNGVRHAGYREEPAVPSDSITPTYAAARLSINNARWEGVPFHMSAGKGLDDSLTEIRVKFRGVEKNIFCESDICPESNELVIRIQPDASIRLRITNKVPGMKMSVRTRDLDLHYRDAFEEIIPEAYESLLLDVMQGDKSLFIRSDELEAAWDIFTQALHEIERRRLGPDPYPFGSNGLAEQEAPI